MGNILASTVVSHPYLVYKDNTEMMNQISGNLVSSLPSVTNLEGKTISILEAQMLNERAKEEQFIAKIQDYLTDNNLSHLYKAGNFSQMLTIFDAYQKGIIKDCETLEEALKLINNYYQKFNFKNSKQFIINFFSSYGDELIGQNIDYVFNSLENYINQCFNDPKELKVMQKAFAILKQSYFKSAKHLSSQYTFTEADRITLQEHHGNEKTILEALRSQLHGIFSGLPGEVVVGGGSTGTQLKGGKNPDTDIIQVFSADATMELPEQENLLSLQATYEEMRELEKKLDDCYVIHYSVKASSGSAIKFKDEASYAVRLGEIQALFQEMGISTSQDFIFFLANTVPDMAADGRFNEIRDSVIQLTTMYMFDDILPSVAENINKETYNEQKLNFYNIGGKIFCASEIFRVLLESVNHELSSKKKTFISMSQKGAHINYENTVKGIEDQEQRWAAVYNTAMAANKISMMRLNVKNLAEALLTM